MLQNCLGVHVLTLQGTPKERAENHGALLGKELSPAVVRYFSEKIFEPVKGKLSRFALEHAYHLWTRLYHRATPKEFVEELAAQAHGMKVEPLEIERAILLPDTANFINRWSHFNFLKRLPDVGCTSVAVKEGKNFTLGRNLDFASTTLWDRYPQITVQIPEEGSKELRHIAIGAAGVQFGGITGVNEAGITFAVHQNYSLDASMGGIPMFLIGEMVLRKARNLKDAEEILRVNRPGPLWTFVVSDLYRGEAMAVESSMRHFSVRRMLGEAFAQTNHIQTTSIRPWEYITVGTKKNSEFRYQLAMKMAQAKNGLSPAGKVAGILSYQKDKNGELSSYQDVLKAHTIQTAIFQRSGEEISLYLSYEPAPTSSGRYLRFNLKDFWEKRGALPYSVAELVPTTTKQRKNQMDFAKSFAAYFDEQDMVKALDLVKNQASVGALLLKSVLSYRIDDGGSKKHFEYAIQHAELGLKKADSTDPAYILQSLQWVKLLSLLQLEKQEQAEQLAKNLLAQKPENPRLQEIAAKVAKGKSLSSSDMRLGFEFFSGDLSGHPN